MLPTNNSYHSSTFIPTIRAIAIHGSVTIDGGRGERPSPPKHDGGASAARSSGPRPSPSPAMPELAPHPWDPVRVPATNAAAPLFLPPALSLIHPALYLPASIFVLLTPARNPASLLAAAPSLSSPRRQQCRQPAQHQSHEGPIAGGCQAAGHPVRIVIVPAVQGRGGEGRRTQCPVAPGIVQPLGWVPPHGHPSLSPSSSGARRGGSACGGSCWARRQQRKRQWRW